VTQRRDSIIDRYVDFAFPLSQKRGSMNDYPTLHTMVKDVTKTSPHQVRHLIVVPVDGSKVTMLMQLICGAQTEIATGTEYEMGQKANSASPTLTPGHGINMAPSTEDFRPKS